MEKKRFSKQKGKTFGLCGLVLASAVLALDTANITQADETSPQVSQAAEVQTSTASSENLEQGQAVTSEQQETSVSTEKTVTAAKQIEDSNLGASTNKAASDESKPETGSKQAQSAENLVQNTETSALATDTPQTKTEQETTGQSTKNQRTEEPKTSSSNTASSDEKQTAVYSSKDAYGSTNFTSSLTDFAKTAQVADIIYNGQRDEYIVVDDPRASYVPNAQEIAKHLRDYLSELRRINQIDIPVPSVDQVIQAYAQARADEEAREKNRLDHETKIPYPTGLTALTENGHMDNFKSINRTTADGYRLSSDKATAYYLAMNWFADYFNIYSDPNDGLQSFGHAISVLSSGGSGMGLGFAAGQGGESQMWYAQLEFARNDGQDDDETGFTSFKNEKGDWVLYYKGVPVKFLPNTTFWYIKASDLTTDPDQEVINKLKLKANVGVPVPAQKLSFAQAPQPKIAQAASPQTAFVPALQSSGNNIKRSEQLKQFLPQTNSHSFNTRMTIWGASLVLASLGLGLGIRLLSKGQGQD